MTASEKVQELIENNKLTDEQLEDLNAWGIQRVSDLEDYLIDQIKDKSNMDYEEDVVALYDLLDYYDDDYVMYDENGVTKLDFDTLDDAFNIDLLN